MCGTVVVRVSQEAVPRAYHLLSIECCGLLFTGFGASRGCVEDEPDITLAFRDSLARISCSDLELTVRECMAVAAASDCSKYTPIPSGGGLVGSLWGSSGGGVPAASGAKPVGVGPLPFQRWDLPRSVRSCSDAVCLGRTPTDLYSALQGVSEGNCKLSYCIGEEWVSEWKEI